MNKYVSFLGLCAVFLLRAPVGEMSADPSSHHSVRTPSSMPETVAKFKLDFHHFLQSARIRKKRESGLLALTDENAFVKEHLRVESYAAEDLPYLADYNLTFWTSVRHQAKNGVLIGTAKGDLVLFELHDRVATTVARSVKEAIGYKAKAFSHYEEEWFIILQPTVQDTYIRLYKRVGRGIERRQTIVLEGESDFDLVTVRGIHYLAVATYKARTSQGYTYQAHVALYHWTRTQFDLIATRTTYGARSLACWAFDGSLYLSVAQETNDDKNLYLGSPVFMYNAKEESNLVLVETLNTKAPRKCAYFFVSGSHYLIFIGQFDGVIYWWAGNQFLEWQRIPRLAGAVDVSVLSLSNGEVIIAVALKEEILFLTLDAAGYYTLTFTMKFEQFSISSLQFMWDSKDYFALALFGASARSPPHPTWRLSLETYKLPREAALDPLLRCLYRVQSSLDERQSEIENFNSRIDKVWLLDKDQAVPRNVIVNGSISSSDQPIEVDLVQISSTETAVSLWTPSNINENIGRLSSIESSVTSLIKNSLLKSTNQVITGMKNFTGSVETASFVASYLPREFILNGIPILKLATQTLKISGNQTFTGVLHLKGLSVESAEASLINGINTNDLLLLEGDQVVTGSLYFSDIRATDVVTGPNGVLNSIQVDHFVTAHSDQEIRGLKSFRNLKSEVIDVHGNTNGEDLNEISKKIVTIDREGEISGNLEFRDAVDIRGDLFLQGLINNVVNLSHLILIGVDKHSHQEITGTKVFHSSVHISGDLHVEGTINGIDLDKDLITLSTPQEISGNLTFASPLTFEGDLLADLVNGVDLDTQAVMRSGDDQFIEGHKTFGSLLSSEEIKMGDKVTLDGVDPSELAKTLVQHENGFVKDSVVIADAVVLGNLIAEEGVNNFPIKDLPDIAYLKSTPQVIQVPVFFPGSIITEDLEVDVVDGLDLDSDVVHSFGDEEILSHKEFPESFHVNSFSIQEGKLFGGSDFASFGDTDQSPDDAAIRGLKVFQSLEIKGNIEVELIDGLDLSKDIMLKDIPQRVSGKKTFKSGIVSGELQTENVIPGRVNGRNLTEFISNAVLRRPVDAREIRNKTFTQLKASSLHIPARGKIDGVFIPEMLLKAVTLNTSQYIMSDKTFTGSLGFAGPVSSARVNDLDLVSHVHKVIFLDTEDVIRGKKTVHGDVHVSDLIVHYLVNGVNVTSLAEDAVYKSRSNEINAPMIFSSDIGIGSLIVEKPARVDGVLMEDLVLIHEDAYISSAEFRTNIFTPANMNIGGLVNDCDLREVVRRALKVRGAEQILTGRIELDSLNVTGSVTFRDTVSGREVADLFKVVTRSGQVIDGNFHFTSGISVRSLRVKGLIEGIDLDYIIKDAVRQSLPQVIIGKKIFMEDLEVAVLESMDGLFVTETVNGVLLKELSESVVWKDTSQVIHGEKVFKSLHINNATVLGYLNGLQFPRDVVLTHTSDRIPGSVHLMNDLVIESHLTVHGKLDGVHLDSFLDRRVTLRGKEELAGEITFQKDLTVTGDLFVDGMINDIVLDMAVRSYKDNRINGIKQFSKDLTVRGSLSTVLVNGYNLTELLGSLLRLDGKEDLHGLQVFTGPIHLSSVVVDNINGIALEQLEGTYLKVSGKILAAESFFDGESQAQQEQIANAMEATLYQISDFAYFVRVQELNLGSSDKIVAGQRIRSKGNLFYQYMVLWTTRIACATAQKCCESTFSYWLEADNEGLLTAIKEPQEGRYFPVMGSNLFPADGNFVVWTNTTVEQQTWCHSGIHETTEIGNVESVPFKVLLTVKNSPFLTDVKAFRDGKLYIIAAYYFDKRNGEYSRSVVYAYNDMLKEWKEHQMLSAYGVLAMDVTTFKTDSTILLALGTGLGSYPNSELLLYLWNDSERAFVEMQRRPSDYVTSVLWVNNKNQKLLVVSSVQYWPGFSECSKEISGGQVSVYEYYNTLRWIQSIPLSGVVSVVSFQIAGETFLAAASRQMETVYILRWKGFGGFSVVQAIPSHGVRHLNTYRRRRDLFVAVASASGKSSVLKAVVRGRTYYQRSVEEFPAELSDAPDYMESSQISC